MPQCLLCHWTQLAAAQRTSSGSSMILLTLVQKQCWLHRKSMPWMPQFPLLTPANVTLPPKRHRTIILRSCKDCKLVHFGQTLAQMVVRAGRSLACGLASFHNSSVMIPLYFFSAIGMLQPVVIATTTTTTTSSFCVKKQPDFQSVF